MSKGCDATNGCSCLGPANESAWKQVTPLGFWIFEGSIFNGVSEASVSGPSGSGPYDAGPYFWGEKGGGGTASSSMFVQFPTPPTSPWIYVVFGGVTPYKPNPYVYEVHMSAVASICSKNFTDFQPCEEKGDDNCGKDLENPCDSISPVVSTYGANQGVWFKLNSTGYTNIQIGFNAICTIDTCGNNDGVAINSTQVKIYYSWEETMEK